MVKGFVLGLLAATGVFFGVSLLARTAAPAAAAPADRPVGFWECEFQDFKLTLQVEADQLHLMMEDHNGKILFRGDADYSVSREGLVYGVVTSMAASDDEMSGAADFPFRLRWRLDGDILTVKNLGLSDTDEKLKEWCGRFRRTAARELGEPKIEKKAAGVCPTCVPAAPSLSRQAPKAPPAPVIAY
jgi:hypothetical protein